MTTPLDVSAILSQLHNAYYEAFQGLFVVGRNGTLRCRNQDIPRFDAFFNTWRPYFLENGMRLPRVRLQRAFMGDIGTSNDNHRLLLCVYGHAFSLYLKVCHQLGREPDDQFTEAVAVQIDA